MANPNIMTISAIRGKTVGIPVTTVKTTIISNVVQSGQLLKVNSVVVSNGESTTRSISLAVKKAATTYSASSVSSVAGQNAGTYTLEVPMSAGPFIVNGAYASGTFTGTSTLGISNSLIPQSVTANGTAYTISMTGATSSYSQGTHALFTWTNPTIEIPLESAIELPGKSSIVLVSRDSGLYLEEGDYLYIWSETSGSLTATCSFEAIGQGTII